MPWSGRDIVNRRLKELGWDIKELSRRTGRGYSYLWKLLRMEDEEAPSNPSEAVIRDIANALGIPLEDLLPQQRTVGEFVLDKLYSLPKDEKERLQRMTLLDRVHFVLGLLQQEPAWSSDSALAEALGIPPATIRAIKSGHEPEGPVMRQLMQATGLSYRFWGRGKLDPHPDLVADVLANDEAAEYLEAVRAAIQARISPVTLKNLINAIKREAE